MSVDCGKSMESSNGGLKPWRWHGSRALVHMGGLEDDLPVGNREFFGFHLKLLGGIPTYPSEKYWSSQLGWFSPTEWRKKHRQILVSWDYYPQYMEGKNMFQTTKQQISGVWKLRITTAVLPKKSKPSSCGQPGPGTGAGPIHGGLKQHRHVMWVEQCH